MLFPNSVLVLFAKAPFELVAEALSYWVFDIKSIVSIFNIWASVVSTVKYDLNKDLYDRCLAWQAIDRDLLSGYRYTCGHARALCE
ncbi:hypothetical protein HOY80DRAFT_966590 [Tuber brumale]|nr:hypothetical protein HOY80DRAFT_966590 [Tuber brumale]